MSDDATHYCRECVRLAMRLADAEIALHKIAAPVRPDGSWNRDRAACQFIAAEFFTFASPAVSGTPDTKENEDA